MRPLRHFTIVAISIALALVVSARAQSTFPDASETVPELIEMWEDSNSVCRGANGGDVKVAAACLSRSVYGLALNERDWCYGRDGEANAQMTWHECMDGSLRFPPFEIPRV